MGICWQIFSALWLTKARALDVHLVEASSDWQATSDLYQFSFEEGSVSLDLLRVEAAPASREASTWVITAVIPLPLLGFCRMT